MNKIPHAISRSLERYGLKLTHGDLLDMCMECQKGYGRLAHLPDGKERHVVMSHGKALVVIYAPFNGTTVRQKEGRIITALPKSAASPGAKGSPAATVNGKRLRPRKLSPKRSRMKLWK